MDEKKQYTDKRFTFKKSERLCYEKSIDRLFKEGKSFIAYPLRVVYWTTKTSEEEQVSCRLLISVPKRKFKRANKRNRIKRLVRETYRLNKHELAETLEREKMTIDVAVIYLKDELPTYVEMEKAMLKMLATLKEECLKFTE